MIKKNIEKDISNGTVTLTVSKCCDNVEVFSHIPNLNDKNDVVIRVSREIYDKLVDLRKALWNVGLDNIPKELAEFAQLENAKVYKEFKWTHGNVIEFATLAVRYLLKRKENEG